MLLIHAILSDTPDGDLLGKFDFVMEWPTLPEDQKLVRWSCYLELLMATCVVRDQAKYSEFACHELHFFLYHKDRAFFDRVVLPFIKNKLQV